MRTLGIASIAAATLLLSTGQQALADEPGRHRRWGIGLHSIGQSLSSESDPENVLQMGGGGVHVRWNATRRFTLELDLDGLHADMASGGYVRDSSPATLAVLYHLVPRWRWDTYLLLGLGGTTDEVTYRKVDGSSATETFHESHVHLGAGVERRFGRIGIGAELRFVGLARSEEEAGAFYADHLPYGPVWPDSSGAQGSLGVTFYF